MNGVVSGRSAPYKVTRNRCNDCVNETPYTLRGCVPFRIHLRFILSMMGARLSRSSSRTQKLLVVHVVGLNTRRNVPRTSETYVTRVCVIGERGVGKLADRFTKNQFGDDETDGGVPPQYRCRRMVGPPTKWTPGSIPPRIDGPPVPLS